MAKKNILEQKQSNLEAMRAQARSLVSLVTNTVSSLKEVNSKIDSEIADIDSVQASLMDTRDGLAAERKRNETIIHNFSRLVGDVE